MTDVPLREYVDGEIQSVKRLLLALRDADENRDMLLRENIAHRLEVLNEFSARMKNLEATFATREAVETLEKSIRHTIEALDKADRDALETVKDRIKSLEATRDENVGRSSAWTSAFVFLAALAALSAVVSVIITIVQVTG